MIVGKAGMAVVISAETARLLETSGLSPTELRVRLRGRRPDIAQELLDLREVGMSFDPRSLPATAETEGASAEMATELGQWLNSSEVADRLKITDRRVRQLCDEGVIPGAEKVGGRWRLSLEDFNRYRAARAA